MHDPWEALVGLEVQGRLLAYTSFPNRKPAITQRVPKRAASATRRTSQRARQRSACAPGAPTCQGPMRPREGRRGSERPQAILPSKNPTAMQTALNSAESATSRTSRRERLRASASSRSLAGK